MTTGRKIRSVEEIAREYRRRLGVDLVRWLDPLTVLRKLRHEIPGVDFATVDPKEIAPSLAKWDSEKGLIRIGNDTFAAANGPRADGRARFSMFHEAIHVLSGHQGQLNRLHSRTDIPKYAIKLRAIEADTDKITAAFMAPRHLIPSGWTAVEVAFFFGMSSESARLRVEEIRGPVRQKRKVPDSVTQLLLQLERRPGR